jgi:hypothetical protein
LNSEVRSKNSEVRKEDRATIFDLVLQQQVSFGHPSPAGFFAGEG